MDQCHNDSILNDAPLSVEDYNSFFRNHFGRILEPQGFSYSADGKVSRWLRLTEKEILHSIQFIQDHSMVFLYFGFQPIFFPVELPKNRLGHHDRSQSYFHADLLYRQIHREERIPYFVLPLSPASRDQAVGFWEAVIHETILPILNAALDLPGCHNEYLKLREYSRADFRMHFDGWYLLECVKLRDKMECKRICDSILLPLINERGADYRVCLAYEWLRERDPKKQGVAAAELAQDLSGDMSLLLNFAAQTEARSRKLLKKLKVCE